MGDWYVKAIPEDPGRRRKLLFAAGGGVAALVLVGALMSAGTPAEHDIQLTPPPGVEQATSATVFVHVAGLVAKPGVYELALDARVFDAIAAAGGLTATADGTSVNLARIVQDGEQIVVGAAGSGSTPVAGGKLNINRAEASDFDTLPRIGPTLAERIVAYRDEHGPFPSIDALGNVPGIGDVTLAGFRDQLTL
ncbi:MAG: ComEA family DNA-binding protein [Microbacteriaceae bacterium]